MDHTTLKALQQVSFLKEKFFFFFSFFFEKRKKKENSDKKAYEKQLAVIDIIEKQLEKYFSSFRVKGRGGKNNKVSTKKKKKKLWITRQHME